MLALLSVLGAESSGCFDAFARFAFDSRRDLLSYLFHA
jgi:hypothetical protein